jgi:hypothetical protein
MTRIECPIFLTAEHRTGRYLTFLHRRESRKTEQVSIATSVFKFLKEKVPTQVISLEDFARFWRDGGCDQNQEATALSAAIRRPI